MYRSYDTTADALNKQLQEVGVAVLPGVLNAGQIQAFRDGMWATLRFLTRNAEVPIDESSPSSWKTYFDLFPVNDMLLQTHSIGHAQFAWDVRQNPNVVGAFARVWGCKPADLISSFDAISFHPPPEISGGRSHEDGHDWLHVDQSPYRSGLDCVQGLVSACDVCDGDSTLCVLEGSHRFQEAFAAEVRPFVTGDFYRLTKVDRNFYAERGCERFNVLMSAGSLVLWDSRLVHCNMKSTATRKKPNTRMVAYVCQTERSRATLSALALRKKAFDHVMMTSHCGHRPRIFPICTRLLQFDVPLIPKPRLTALGESLIGPPPETTRKVGEGLAVP